MRDILQIAATYLAGFAGLTVLTGLVVLAFDIYVSPGFAMSAVLLKLCGL